ncbi:hypothetical protein [Phormidium tenue]|uniref:Uncharacterized protein n=1 Tax=Phormidium tenue FACHB-1050 TaxID=2692857 RepID=A0ABR8CGK3_9CYAN|nr:hypothetical protein [Phormidium tenue]MBD2319706.1 hypothetical protein [Phormidium tenue FACHB-1050]
MRSHVQKLKEIATSVFKRDHLIIFFASEHILKAIANKFSELNSEMNPFLLTKPWLEIDSVAQPPVH